MTRNLAVLAVLGVASVSSAEAQKTNFIQILTDDQGWGDLESFGHQYIKTPHIDKLAEEGIKLTNCYSAHATSSPSRAAVLTGRTPYRTGVFTWIPANTTMYLNENEVTVTQMMRDQGGYQTAHFGKWHLSHYSETRVSKDTYEYTDFGFSDDPSQPTMKDYGYDYYFATGNVARPDHKDPLNFFLNGEAMGKMEGFSGKIVADQFVKWFKTVRKEGQPFFITVWFHEPHGPINSDPRIMKQYSNVPDESLQQYWANVTQIDEAVGAIVEALKQGGEYENTMIWYTSDNGPEGKDGFGGYGVDEMYRHHRYRGETGGLSGRKRSNHEGGIRVPGIVSWPAGFAKYGRATGDVSAEPVIGSDVMPTMLEVAGIKCPDVTLDGTSILPIIQGKKFKRNQPLYWRNENLIALRDGDWKIVASAYREKFELYNLVMDFRETTDLSAIYPKEFERLKRMLLDYDKGVILEGRKRMLEYPKALEIIDKIKFE